MVDLFSMAPGRREILKAMLGGTVLVLALMLVLAALAIAFVRPTVACAGYVLVLIMWLLPDPRIEKRVDPNAPMPR